MTSNEDIRSYSSLGQLLKPPSLNPTLSSSQRQYSRRTKASKSSANMQRSLVPQKESVFSEGPSNEIIQKSKSELPKECECGPDLYSRVLGPTADETILTGLQTLVDLCNKLRVCGDIDDSGDEEPEREQDLPERDTSSKMKTSNSQTERKSVSAAFQVSPSVKTASSQTIPFPQMVSEILQTVGLTPEMVSNFMQTSFNDLGETKKASVTSIYMQTSDATLASNAMQTSNPILKSGLVQTSSGLMPKIQEPPPQESATTQSDEIRTINRQTMSEPNSLFIDKRSIKTEASIIHCSKSDEHKCIAPPSPPSSKEHCKCCKCSSSQSLKKASKESKSSITKTCICGIRRKSKCKCGAFGKKQSVMSVEGDQQPPLEVKYAVTKISKYKEFTTFEVMKSTKNVPKQMPKGIEGVFVLKKKNGNGNGKNSKISNNSNKTSNSATKSSRTHVDISTIEDSQRSKVENY